MAGACRPKAERQPGSARHAKARAEHPLVVHAVSTAELDAEGRGCGFLSDSRRRCEAHDRPESK